MRLNTAWTAIILRSVKTIIANSDLKGGWPSTGLDLHLDLCSVAFSAIEPL